MNNEDIYIFTKDELEKLLKKVINLSMDLRQSQLQGYSNISGNDLLKNIKAKI